MTRALPELLAPAGDFSALTAAINAGCDAVYLGARQFSMRSAPQNFTVAQIRRAAAQCHERGVKVYVTVNTIIFDSERPALGRLLDGLQGVVDAVICWDPAVFTGCRQRGIPFHISTQASVSNAESARYYASLGASRIVLARECTLADIKRIHRETGVELEVFAHGAMCMSESGRCFLSQDTYGKSGNRGECRQNCRRPYRVICQDGPGDYEVFPNSHFIFSAKDLCTMPFLDKLLASGASSLKIEGRNRPADYVYTVISAYRQAMDAWARRELTDELKSAMIQQCQRVFNREFSTGFFLGRPVVDFTPNSNSSATERRVQLGDVINFYAKPSVAYVRILNGQRPKDGDTVVIIGPTTGSVRCEISDVRLEADETRPNCITATFKVPSRVRPGDAAYLIEVR